jgi:hypothetical protein
MKGTCSNIIRQVSGIILLDIIVFLEAIRDCIVVVIVCVFVCCIFIVLQFKASSKGYSHAPSSY